MKTDDCGCAPASSGRVPAAPAEKSACPQCQAPAPHAHSAPALEELKTWLLAHRGLKTTSLGKAVHYTLNNWHHLQRFTANARIWLARQQPDRALAARPGGGSAQPLRLEEQSGYPGRGGVLHADGDRQGARSRPGEVPTRGRPGRQSGSSAAAGQAVYVNERAQTHEGVRRADTFKEEGRGAV